MLHVMISKDVPCGLTGHSGQAAQSHVDLGYKGGKDHALVTIVKDPQQLRRSLVNKKNAKVS